MKRYLVPSLALIASLCGCVSAQSAESFAVRGCSEFTEMIATGYPQISFFSVDQIVLNPKKEIRKTFPYAGVWTELSRAIITTESRMHSQINQIGAKFDSAAKRNSKYVNLSNVFAKNFGDWKPIPQDWIYVVSGSDKDSSRVFDIGLANGIPWNSTTEALARATLGQIPPSAKFDILEDIESECRILTAS